MKPNPETERPLFDLEAVSVRFQSKSILNELTLSIPEGIIHAVIGPSGSGKTTFLRLLNAMTHPTDGSIRFRGRSIASYPVTQYRRHIPIVFQEPVLVQGTIRNNLMIPFRLKRWKAHSPSPQKIEEVLSTGADAVICFMPGQCIERSPRPTPIRARSAKEAGLGRAFRRVGRPRP